jgi:hypothetical protein
MRAIARTWASPLAILIALLVTGCRDGVGPGLPPAPAALAAVSGLAQTGVAGAELSAPLVVLVTDENQMPLPNVVVGFSVVSGGGAVVPLSTATNASGRVETRWTLGTSTATPHRAEAKVSRPGRPDLVVEFVATAVPGPPAVIEVSAPAPELPVGASIQLSAAVADAYANPIAGVPVVWTVSPAGIASVTTAGAATGVARGNATFTATAQGASGSLTLPVVERASPSLELRFTLGAPEVVFSYRQHRCEVLDLPDMTARAVRMADGTIALYSGNAPNAYASFGPDFASLRRSCVPTLVSDDDHTAASFSNQEWLSTVYREGNVYHAIVHNEYHDPVHPNCKAGDTSPANPCWYNGLTYASSLDGRVFTQPPAPSHVLAGPPQQWDASGARAPGPYGYFAPSNIVKREDGYYYAMFFTIPERDDQQKRGSCVMRTDDLADPARWRAWDGAAFALAMPSPYDRDATGVACRIVVPHGIDGSLTYNTHLQRYIYVGGTGANVNGVVTCGFIYATSTDLIDWSPPGVLKLAPVPFPPCGSGPNVGREYYPSLIDHADTSVNFEFTGSTPHLYYMKYMDGALERDLLRVPVTIEVIGGR